MQITQHNNAAHDESANNIAAHINPTHAAEVELRDDVVVDEQALNDAFLAAEDSHEKADGVEEQQNASFASLEDSFIFSDKNESGSTTDTADETCCTVRVLRDLTELK